MRQACAGFAENSDKSTINNRQSTIQRQSPINNPKAIANQQSKGNRQSTIQRQSPINNLKRE
jgi:hypothetical protein